MRTLIWSKFSFSKKYRMFFFNWFGATLVGESWSFLFTLITVHPHLEWIFTFLTYKIPIFAGLLGLVTSFVEVSITRESLKNKFILGINLVIAAITGWGLVTIPTINQDLAKGFLTEAFIAPAWESSHIAIWGTIFGIVSTLGPTPFTFKLAYTLVIRASITILIFTVIGMYIFSIVQGWQNKAEWGICSGVISILSTFVIHRLAAPMSIIDKGKD